MDHVFCRQGHDLQRVPSFYSIDSEEGERDKKVVMGSVPKKCLKNVGKNIEKHGETKKMSKNCVVLIFSKHVFRKTIRETDYSSKHG